jgi:hypothetical protein
MYQHKGEVNYWTRQLRRRERDSPTRCLDNLSTTFLATFSNNKFWLISHQTQEALACSSITSSLTLGRGREEIDTTGVA